MSKKESITLARVIKTGYPPYKVISTKNTLRVIVGDTLSEQEVKDLIRNTQAEITIKPDK